MNNIKNNFKQKNFQININIINTIKYLDITLNEFLLILYFINIEESLDLNKIKEILSFTQEETLSIYTSLISKGLIEIKVIKENGKVTETISLDMFYDKLIMSTKKNEPTSTDIYSKFESEFSRSLSPIEYETINRWLESGISENIITDALRESVLNGITNFRYIDKIIYEWTKKGKKSTPKEEYQELFDYNWLGEEDE